LRRRLSNNRIALVITEEKAGKKFGDPYHPFWYPFRSGARASMPGMMDTILNLGLNDETVVGLAKLTNNERFAFDSYRVSSRCFRMS
jgi:pyruvate,orthophosphate dikinase